MGAHSSKRDKLKNFQINDKVNNRKKYLPAKNGNSPAVNGCAGSTETPCEIEEVEEELPPFTDRQKELVTETWRVVQEDMARVGVIMFIK